MQDQSGPAPVQQRAPLGSRREGGREASALCIAECTSSLSKVPLPGCRAVPPLAAAAAGCVACAERGSRRRQARLYWPCRRAAHGWAPSWHCSWAAPQGMLLRLFWPCAKSAAQAGSCKLTCRRRSPAGSPAGPGTEGERKRGCALCQHTARSQVVKQNADAMSRQ